MLNLQDGLGPLKKKKKRRLDEVCVELHPQYTKNVIQSFIAQGGLLGCAEKGRRVTETVLLCQPCSIHPTATSRIAPQAWSR